MYQIKTFSDSKLHILEAQINIWLRDNSKDNIGNKGILQVISIEFTHTRISKDEYDRIEAPFSELFSACVVVETSYPIFP